MHPHCLHSTVVITILKANLSNKAYDFRLIQKLVKVRSNVSDAQVNRGVGHFGPKFRGVPLGADPSRWDYKERTSRDN